MSFIEAKNIVESVYPGLINSKNTSRRNAWICKQLLEKTLEHLDEYNKELHELNVEFKRLMGEFQLAEAQKNDFLMGVYYNALMLSDNEFEAIVKITDRRKREAKALFLLLEYYYDESMGEFTVPSGTKEIIINL